MQKKKLYLILAALTATAAVSAAPNDGAVLAGTCAGCHGTDGASVGPAPIIGGLSEAYLASAMAAYKDGTRYSTIMGRIARGYDPGQILDMSKYLAAQPWVSGTEKVDETLAEQGKAIHNGKGCAGCHGANGVSPMPTTPRLTGQYARYLEMQMQDYKDANKAIPPAAMIMRSMIAPMSDDEIKALAAFYASAK
jgi:sulfide dehydrogenase cytochrome subunit